ncbi:MAG: hypothetical protein K2Y35_12730 [Burkholderiales bacterium]|nr:hypothetical protein [Burkholderiales bacterium]
MGEGLADHRPEFAAGGRDWRTPPLWGLGLSRVVNGNTTMLHDGRARNATEAILWHGGEAAGSREAFAKMTAGEREALLAFLDAIWGGVARRIACPHPSLPPASRGKGRTPPASGKLGEGAYTSFFSQAGERNVHPLPQLGWGRVREGACGGTCIRPTWPRRFPHPRPFALRKKRVHTLEQLP